MRRIGFLYIVWNAATVYWSLRNMNIVRTSQMQYLQHYYETSGSQLIVLYGQSKVGKTTLVQDFIKDKSHFYFYARPCSEREMQYQWGKELEQKGISVQEYPSYDEIFFSLTKEAVPKQIIVIDEFQNAVHAGENFMDSLTSFMHNEWDNQSVFIILVSSAIGWVENIMVSKIGKAAYEISGFLKIREFGFGDLERYFGFRNKEQSIETFATIGGTPGFWQYFEKDKSYKENVCEHILDRKSYLHDAANRLVEEELRETNVYHSILAAIASGKYKLNDLHLHTGFSRAKISVYLKNLMELEIVEKVFSYDTAGKENTMKGIYRITNSLVHFYFRFMYPHLSDLETMAPEAFYEKYIEKELDHYVEEHFRKACESILNEMNQNGRLPIKVEDYGEWVGKLGSIHYLGESENGKFLVAYCNWEKPVFDYSDYEWFLFSCEKAKVKPDYIYIFNRGKFDSKLLEAGAIHENLHLISMMK